LSQGGAKHFERYSTNDAQNASPQHFHGERLVNYNVAVTIVVCFIFLSFSSTAFAQNADTAHPLDPLTGGEIQAAVATLRAAGKVTNNSRFPLIHLHEPPKADALNFKPGSPMRREAFVVVYERASNQTFEAIVDVNGRRVVSWKEIANVQPAFMLEDIVLATDIVRSHPQWQAALRKRGINDFQNVQVDPWSAGYYGNANEDRARRCYAVSYYKSSAQNAYARPIEGVVAYVNLTTRKVERLVDTGVVPVPKATSDYNAKAVGRLRTPPKPLQILQPQGASFEVRGREVRWQNWRFRFALHPREGLVLYAVAYEDNGKPRSVLYRASLSEMVVPYGDPSAGWFFKNVFDEGEANLGWLCLSLEPRTDAPLNVVFFDSVMTNQIGAPYVIPRAVALYERDGGILWKHAEFFASNESRRARQLVLSCVATVGNYDYGFHWIFHQDGTLEQETLLTGVMTTKAVTRASDAAMPHGETSHGHLVMPFVEAVHHQHFFNFRLDFDVDGVGNSVVEMNTESLPMDASNPYGGAFVMKETPLRHEQDAQRSLNLASNRKWKVVNPSVQNALGQPVGYALLPGENTVPFAHPDSWVRKRAGFVNAHVWATPFSPTEMNAGGAYPNQSRGGDGLTQWIRANRSLDNQDIVLWYTMGVTHIPRPEDWPIMPGHRLGFKLAPLGFFTRNPALDVPKGE
jgi:primary-amine oxidase